MKKPRSKVIGGFIFNAPIVHDGVFVRFTKPTKQQIAKAKKWRDSHPLPLGPGAKIEFTGWHKVVQTKPSKT